MNLSLTEIEAEARQLSSEERDALIGWLVRETDSENPILPEIADAWADEAERRDLEMERGEVEGIPLDEVIRQAGIRVTVVAHQNRRPGYGERRS